MRPKRSAEELERRRWQAMALMGQGMKPSAVARAVGKFRASVTRWRPGSDGCQATSGWRVLPDGRTMNAFDPHAVAGLSRARLATRNYSLYQELRN